MKFTVLINTRSHPEGLITTVMNLLNTARDPKEITFAIRVDNDDAESILACQKLSSYGNVSTFIGNRPGSMGREHNEMARKCPADVYLIMNDSVYTCPVTMIPDKDSPTGLIPEMIFWDQYIKVAMEDHKFEPCMCWHLAVAKSADYPIIPHKWFEATGRIFPEYFPWWFDDQWLLSVHQMVYGKSVIRLDALMIHAPKTGVQRMRDSEIWIELYRATVGERIAEAEKVQAAYGMPVGVDPKVLKKIDYYERIHHKSFKKKEKVFGDKRPPDPSYLAAKEQALTVIEHYKKQNGQV